MSSYIELSEIQSKRLGMRKCPECRGELLSGPAAGIVTNIACEDCWAEYSYIGLLYAILKNGYIDSSRALNVYGIENPYPRIKITLMITTRRPLWKRILNIK